MYSIFSITSGSQVQGRSRIPHSRGASRTLTYDFAKFSKKLHVIENILGRSPPPLESVTEGHTLIM